MRNKFLGSGNTGYHPLDKLKIVAAGFRFAVAHDPSVARKVIASAVVIGFSLWWRQWIDVVIVLLATGQALAAELFNTALEAVCDFVKAERDERIKVIKDVAAAATGVSTLVWVLVLLWEYTQLLLWLNRSWEF